MCLMQQDIFNSAWAVVAKLPRGDFYLSLNVRQKQTWPGIEKCSYYWQCDVCGLFREPGQSLLPSVQQERNTRYP